MMIKDPPVLWLSGTEMVIKGSPLLRSEIIDVNQRSSSTSIWICNANQRSSSALIWICFLQKVKIYSCFVVPLFLRCVIFHLLILDLNFIKKILIDCWWFFEKDLIFKTWILELETRNFEFWDLEFRVWNLVPGILSLKFGIWKKKINSIFWR